MKMSTETVLIFFVFFRQIYYTQLRFCCQEQKASEKCEKILVLTNKLSYNVR